MSIFIVLLWNKQFSLPFVDSEYIQVIQLLNHYNQTNNNRRQ